MEILQEADQNSGLSHDDILLLNTPVSPLLNNVEFERGVEEKRELAGYMRLLYLDDPKALQDLERIAIKEKSEYHRKLLELRNIWRTGTLDDELEQWLDEYTL